MTPHSSFGKQVSNNNEPLKTTPEVISKYGYSVRKKLKPIFKSLDVPYPPKHLTWIALKSEKSLQLFAPDRRGKNQLLLVYSIIGASGTSGPKLREGDKQVPEGFYKIDGFRPNVIAHLAVSVNYPNAEDIAHARAEKRKNLGSDILIHGSKWSTGCLAMGNEPIEELFVLAHDTGIKNIDLIFAPWNFSSEPQKSKQTITAEKKYSNQPDWLPGLYLRMAKILKQYPLQ
ncbi:MAG: L,D-transpeptidase family protein [Leptolyngbya sp.]|nr:L,D-transpeptidase family protein [Candidatus Melainabacteria bacterium]